MKKYYINNRIFYSKVIENKIMKIKDEKHTSNIENIIDKIYII
jgi:hypothetical protein